MITSSFRSFKCLSSHVTSILVLHQSQHSCPFTALSSSRVTSKMGGGLLGAEREFISAQVPLFHRHTVRDYLSISFHRNLLPPTFIQAALLGRTTLLQRCCSGPSIPMTAGSRKNCLCVCPCSASLTLNPHLCSCEERERERE